MPEEDFLGLKELSKNMERNMIKYFQSIGICSKW
jgi:hypothetical protein